MGKKKACKTGCCSPAGKKSGMAKKKGSEKASKPQQQAASSSVSANDEPRTQDTDNTDGAEGGAKPMDKGFLAYFQEKHPDSNVAVAAVRYLTEVVSKSSEPTMMGLKIELKAAADRLMKTGEASPFSISAACDIFHRFVTRTAQDIPDIDKCKTKLVERGESFACMARDARDRISHYALRFIRNNKKILIHGYSRVVLACLVSAAKEGRHFSVVVSEGRPDCAGHVAAAELKEHGIPVSLIVDGAIGYIMEQVDLVLLGAEGIVENGGIINKVGSYQASIVAKSMQRPVYVAAECYKFARVFPLNQQDVASVGGITHKGDKQSEQSDTPQVENPLRDYTPPNFITLLFTDLGVLTPSAVSDELVKLHEQLS
jgi:translation initiation factor eIF-2B subunit alpha